MDLHFLECFSTKIKTLALFFVNIINPTELNEMMKNALMKLVFFCVFLK